MWVGRVGLCLVVVVAVVVVATVTAYSPLDYKVMSSDTFNIEDETYAGFMPIDLHAESNKDGSLFFWLAKRRASPKQSLSNDNGNDKLLIWLNGGPGCSSMVGMMWENGPFSLAEGDDGHYNFPINPYSWNEAAHVLFVEQPLRTRFSLAANHSRIIHNEKEVAEDFYGFLTSLLQVFPELASSKVFISGESYAGSYIPSIAQYIVNKQSRRKSDSKLPFIDLDGIAIGNGVIDDAIQQSSYTTYAYAHGLIPLATKTLIDDIYTRCMENAATHTKTVDSSEDSCEVMSLVLKAAGNPNEYDTRTFNGYDHIIKPDGVFNKFFNDPTVQEKIHVRGYNVPGINFVPEHRRQLTSNEKPSYYAPSSWSVCNDDINGQLRGNHPQSVVPALQYLVNHIRVLLYNGEADLNTNFLGTLHTLEAHIWNGRRWNEAKRSLFRHNDDVAGEHFELENLSFLIVRNSGHLLPMDIPSTALDMIHRFMNNVSFADTPLPSEREYLQELYRMHEALDNRPPKKISTSTWTDFSILSVGIIGVCLITITYLLITRKPMSPTITSVSLPMSVMHGGHRYEPIDERNA